MNDCIYYISVIYDSPKLIYGMPSMSYFLLTLTKVNIMKRKSFDSCDKKEGSFYAVWWGLSPWAPHVIPQCIAVEKC